MVVPAILNEFETLSGFSKMSHWCILIKPTTCQDSTKRKSFFHLNPDLKNTRQSDKESLLYAEFKKESQTAKN